MEVDGALEFTPVVHHDDRGLFVSPFQETAFARAQGGPLFPVAQASHSRSRRGVVRGVHFTSPPASVAKYVSCPQGEVLDIVVDVREGSPTFGYWEAVRLDQHTSRALYLPPGVGHAFVALRDDTVVSYLLSAEYVAEHERAISVWDPQLGLPIPTDTEPVLSARDRAAPTLAEARAAGILPRYTPGTTPSGGRRT
ncbi:dTDP-4-dehydrorhamnose 3,5-epimerase family protein [Streptomyces taklimakanensis]|nr:dTDP-4-dehydrorhamnose 3,5-epimerase [Streptomyces taklimakanensis]